MMHTYTDEEDNFLVTSPSFPILSQSTLPPFKLLMKDLGEFDNKHMCFRMTGGGTCWFRTGTNPDSVVGIARCRAVLCDEAGLYGLYFWENIQGRAAPNDAPIRIVTSPYSLNWLYKDYIRPMTKDPESLPHVDLVQARSIDNPHFSEKQYYLKQKTMDPRRFNMMFGGQFSRAEGLVYQEFTEEDNTCEPFAIPPGSKVYAGVDWGYTNPFAIVVIAVLPNGRMFQISETYQTQLTIDKKIEVARRKKAVLRIEKFFCDPAGPDDIASFNAAGLSAVPSDNNIRRGVDVVTEHIMTRNFQIFKGTSPHTIDELDTYHYPSPKDLKADTDVREDLPVKQNDHLMDALRYCLVMIQSERHNLDPYIREESAKDKRPVQDRDKELQQELIFQNHEKFH
jgi:PBSX family phage terminase large subunit